MAELWLLSGVPDEASKHLILFHGLGGHCYETWRSLVDPTICWPQWLAEDIHGLAVWTVGYDAAVSRWRGSAMHLPDRARNVLMRILAEPKVKAGEIIFIGHSLGGLVIKQLLQISESMSLHDSEVAHFVRRVRRVAFLATPHLGADLATWGDRLRILIRPSAATACLVRNDPNLRNLNLWYRDWSRAQKVEHLILIESRPTKIAGMVVKPDSSDPGLSSPPIPLDADHITICKPKDRCCEIYVHVRKFITRQLDTVHRDTEIISTLKTQTARIEALSNTTRTSHAQLHELIEAQGKETPGRVADRLQKDITQLISSSRKYPKELVDNEILKQLSILRRSRFFVGFSIAEQSARLAENILHGEFEGGSQAVKSTALAWCARFLAIGEHSAKSDHLLNMARQFGSGPEITIAEAFRISANGDLAEALNKLANVESSTARSAAFRIVTCLQDGASAIEWLAKSQLTLNDLDADGKFFLISTLFDLRRWDIALDRAWLLSEEDFEQAPVLFYTAAIANLVQAVPDELRSHVLQRLPFEVYSFPLASDEVALKARKRAQGLFGQCAFVTRELGCVEVANLAEDYALWLTLCDPATQLTGRQKLEESMRDPAHSLRRLPLALQFGLKLDLDAVEQEIERQTALSGGKSQAAAMARFWLAFTKESPKDVVAYIDRHRAQLQEHLEKKSFALFEIRMLARAGLSQRAEARLQELSTDEIPETERAYYQRIITESGGTDPIEARRTQFDNSGQLDDLIDLVNQLEEQQEWSQLCHYGPLLLERTRLVTDAERLARALHETHRYNELAALLRKYPDFLHQSDNLQSLWSWYLFREGLLEESAAALEKLTVKRDYPQDRTLQVNLAITSGAWETLLPIVEREWSKREERDAYDLLRVAQLAHYVRSPRAKDLVYTAATKGASDASILVTAYSLASRAGWEEEVDVGKWLHRAAELSGDNGPLQKMSLKDLVDQAPEWHRREAETWQQINEGTLPMFGAARLLNKSLVDLFLLPALANPPEPDPRRRGLIPAYSGIRQLVPCVYRVVAVDATTLLTLGMLDLLEITLNTFEHIRIPHSTLGWLFEEKQKVSFHQPSRIRDASKIRHLLALAALKEFRPSVELTGDLAAEVGTELASLLAECQADGTSEERQKIVVRSAPVYRVSSLMEEEADLSSYAPYLCSCLAVVNKLKQRGQLTTSEERRARSYLSLQEKDWPHQPEIADNAVLYLDDLSVSHLQHLGLLEKLQPAGLVAYVSTRGIEEINALLRYEQLTSEMSTVIERIRSFLQTGIRTGRVKLGQMLNFDEAKETPLGHHPSLSVFHLAADTQAIVVDDRFLNQHANIQHDSGLTPITTTSDLLNGLQSQGTITCDKLFDCRTRLRQAGYLFVPVTIDELEHYIVAAEVVDGRLRETAELKAIRENFLQIRMSLALQLPKEGPWLDAVISVFLFVLKAQWRPDVDEAVAIVRSEWLLHLLDLRGWAHCFGRDGDAWLTNYGYSEPIQFLLLPPHNVGQEIAEKYLKWIEERLLTRIRQEEPGLYAWLVEKVKALITRSPQ
ncbi:MAG: esterase/lipase family protein [Candidatus Binatia bacterium]